MSANPTTQVVTEEIIAALTAEAAAAIVAGTTISALRDPRLLRARGAAHPSELLATEFRTIDRTGVRALVRVADAFADHDPGSIAPIGIARLTLLAEAPAAARERLFSSAGQMTTADLRRAIREMRLDRPVSDPIVATRSSMTYAPQDTARIAGELIATGLRALRDLDGAGMRAARACVRLRDLLGPAAGETASIEVGLSRADFERLCRLADRTVTIATELRERIGLRGLRALASIDDESAREKLIAWASSQTEVGAEQVVTRSRELSTTRLQPAVAAPEVATSNATVVPYDVLFLTERPTEQQRAVDATPRALVEQVLLRATAPGETIVDLTAGAGTVALVAAALGRTVVGVDPIDPPLASGIIVGDARTAEIPGGPFAAALLHPPRYGDRFVTERFCGRTQPGDLSVLQAAAYTAAVGELIARAAALIRPDGQVVIIARPTHTDGVFYDWPARFATAAEAVGLVALDRLTAIEAPEERIERERMEIGRAVRESRSVPVTISALRFRLSTAADRRRR